MTHQNKCIKNKKFVYGNHIIRSFEKQVKGWFLDRASDLVKEEDNGFVILMIATAYIEGVEQYRRGQQSNGRSGYFFKEGVKRVFGIDFSSEGRLSDLHKELRCGLFHNGMTGPNIRIHSGYGRPIDLSDGNIIKINQKLFLEKVKEDFEQYLADLRDRTKKDLRGCVKSLESFCCYPEPIRLRSG